MFTPRIILNPQGINVGRNFGHSLRDDPNLSTKYYYIWSKLIQGEAIYFHVGFQSPATNAGNIFFGGEDACYAALTPGQTLFPVSDKINLQDVHVRGPVGTIMVLILT